MLNISLGVAFMLNLPLISTVLIKTRLSIPDCKIDKNTSTSDFKYVLMLYDLRFSALSSSVLWHTSEATVFNFKDDKKSILLTFNILVVSTVLDDNYNVSYNVETSTFVNVQCMAFDVEFILNLPLTTAWIRTRL